MKRPGAFWTDAEVFILSAFAFAVGAIVGAVLATLY